LGKKVEVCVGSSIGAVNTILLGGLLPLGMSDAVETLYSLWSNRSFSTTFSGPPSRAFLKALKITFLKYSSPSPTSTTDSIFDPTPLIHQVNTALLNAYARPDYPIGVGPRKAVMTTVEGQKRRPLLFVESATSIPSDRFVGAPFTVSFVHQLTAEHGLASAALPSVLPPVELNTDTGQTRFVDGGICDNVPVDPALRLGAQDIISVDISGRKWWHDRYGHSHDTSPSWEVPSQEGTWCVTPGRHLELINRVGLGEILRQTVGRSTKDFMAALGPIWPVFKVLKMKMGEELAFEVMSYVALHPNYFTALIERGYEETKAALPEK
jgi:predicted acylesterase/phospholipase RssA